MPRKPRKLITPEHKERIAAMLQGLKRQRIAATKRRAMQRELPFDSELIAEAIISGRAARVSPMAKEYRRKLVKSIVRYAAKEAVADAKLQPKKADVDLLTPVGISLLEAIGMNELMQKAAENRVEELLRAIQASQIRAELTRKVEQLREIMGNEMFEKIWPRFIRYMAEFFAAALEAYSH